MKKSPLRNLVLSAIVLLSLVSFIFINTVQTNVSVHTPASCIKQIEDQAEEEAAFPEVQIVKKLMEQGKGLVPTSGLNF